jgi:hypothetical protein
MKWMDGNRPEVDVAPPDDCHLGSFAAQSYRNHWSLAIVLDFDKLRIRAPSFIAWNEHNP